MPAGVVAERHPLRNLDFRLLWIGSGISLLGDQFYFIALPWLALKMTGSGVILGILLMVSGIPRAIFMLFGGVASDRISPRSILLVTTTVRMFLVAIISVLVYKDLINVWHLYVISFLFGVADAFSLPASQALIPMLVSKEQLSRANSLLAGSAQLTTIAGPLPAAFVLRIWGMATAFAIDAVSFLFAIGAIFRLRSLPPVEQPAQQSFWNQLSEGLRYVGSNTTIRAFMLLVTASNLAVTGPLNIGLLIIAKERFSSVSALGTMMSSLALGSLVGALLPSVLKFQPRRGPLVLVFSVVLGLEIISLGVLRSLTGVAVLLGLLGFGNGLVSVYVRSWFQGTVDQALMGRVVSVFMFAVFGMVPFSNAAAGFLAQINLTGMFVAAGVLVLVVAVITAFHKEIRAIS